MRVLNLDAWMKGIGSEVTLILERPSGSTCRAQPELGPPQSRHAEARVRQLLMDSNTPLSHGGHPELISFI